MQGYYSEKGDGWRLCTSLVVLAAEITKVYPSATCLGTKGDATHMTQATSSDHNPFVTGPNRVGVVRAIDIGGPDAVLKAIRAHLWALYAAHDPRVYFYGYAKGCSDNLINNWSVRFGTHTSYGDAGHLHISVTQANGGNPRAGRSGYVAAIDSTAPWGFLPPVKTAPIITKDWFDMATEAQLRAIVKQEIHADNVRQAQAILAGHGNKHYTPAEVAAMFDVPNAAPLGLVKRLGALLAKS